MVLMLGKNSLIREEELIGIFDLDNCSQSRLTREFLAAAEKKGLVINTAEDLPNSFVLCKDALYLAQASSRKTAGKLESQNGEYYGGKQG